MGGIFQRPNDEAEIGLVNSADDLPKLYGALVYQRGCDLQYPHAAAAKPGARHTGIGGQTPGSRVTNLSGQHNQGLPNGSGDEHAECAPAGGGHGEAFGDP